MKSHTASSAQDFLHLSCLHYSLVVESSVALCFCGNALFFSICSCFSNKASMASMSSVRMQALAFFLAYPRGLVTSLRYGKTCSGDTSATSLSPIWVAGACGSLLSANKSGSSPHFLSPFGWVGLVDSWLSWTIPPPGFELEELVSQ